DLLFGRHAAVVWLVRGNGRWLRGGTVLSRIDAGFRQRQIDWIQVVYAIGCGWTRRRHSHKLTLDVPDPAAEQRILKFNRPPFTDLLERAERRPFLRDSQRFVRYARLLEDRR